MLIKGLEVDEFLEAAKDLRYLLGQEYPRPGSLTFIGNRYQLSKSRREILNRGVYPGHEALVRRRRLLSPERIKGRAVAVDGYNVIITLESALVGRDLIACDDGPIRDAAWVSSSFRPSEATDQALDLILNYLAGRGALSIVFFLYAPMAMSGELAVHIHSLISSRGLMGRARTAASPKAEMRSFPGLVATSDSVLIDLAAEPIDLAGHLIRERLPNLSLISLNRELEALPE
ncbi:MAG: DUF434 domain-containing protein [Deltaproteobacteria bacterium]|nr:DUF434 domain-containing protein [Deltaproteobacteria bacterium]